MKRGQAAVEYLVTYGWVFIVILGAIGVLSYFDLLTPSQYLPERCDFGQQLVCVDTYIDTSGTAVLRFKNVFSANITVTEAYMFNGETEQMESIFHGQVPGGGDVDIGQNEIGRVQFDMNRIYSEGSKARARVIVQFERTGGSIQHNLSGSFVAEVSEVLAIT